MTLLKKLKILAEDTIKYYLIGIWVGLIALSVLGTILLMIDYLIGLLV